MSRRLHVLALLVGVVGFLSAGCAATVTVDETKAALMAQDKAWSQTTKDLNKFLGYYAADANVYAPGMPLVTGTAAIREAFTKMSSAPGFALRWTAKKADAGASGELGYTAGTYEMTMNDAAGKPSTDKGKYLTVWKKQADGQWKATEDILNSDTPPPPPAPASAPKKPAPPKKSAPKKK